MNDRERFVACILGEPADRPPYWLYWDPWRTTWERWEKEGKPQHIKDARSSFGADQKPLTVPVNCGPCPRIERCVIEENDTFVTYIDSWGIKRRDFKHHESMSEFIEFPVKSRRDWENFKEEYLDPDNPERLSGNWREVCAQWMASGWPIQLGWFPDVTLYGAVRWLLGDEECLAAFYTMPDLIHDIMDHMTSIFLTVFGQVVKDVRVDVIHMWEDMCGQHGPLISPQHWDEFMGPNYRRIKRFAVEHGIPVLAVDTDGNPDLIAPCMIRAGVNWLYPMEVAAGCDVNVWRSKYPDLALLGGIDKRALTGSPQTIDRELERIRPAMARGRYIPDLDHLVPDDVSWENYCYFAGALKALVGKP